jgi:biopolymer transport protein TolQ
MTFLLEASFLSSYTQADFLGKMIFWVLFILSIISWVIMIKKIKYANLVKKNSKIFEEIFEEKKEKLLLLKVDPSFEEYNPFLSIYSDVKQKTLEILNKNSFFSNKEKVYLSKSDIELIESQIVITISKESKFLEKNLFILSTTVTLAPFLGLLGTVWGILITFSNLQAGIIKSVNSQVLSGLSMALSTTVLGLLVAIPPLISYNYLKNVLKEFSKDMDHFSNNLMTTLELQYKRVEKDA